MWPGHMSRPDRGRGQIGTKSSARIRLGENRASDKHHYRDSALRVVVKGMATRRGYYVHCMRAGQYAAAIDQAWFFSYSLRLTSSSLL